MRSELFFRNWGISICIAFGLAHCNSSSNVAPVTKSDTASPAITKRETSPENRPIYKISGPRDSQPPGRYSRVEWEEADVRVSGEIELDDTDNRPEQIFEAAVRGQKSELLRCARSEPNLWHANFFPTISFSKSEVPELSLERRFVATRNGIADDTDERSIRLTACIRRSLEKSLKAMSGPPEKEVSFRLSLSRPNPERYITVGKLERFNGKTDFVSVDTGGRQLCGADRGGRVTCWTRDHELPLPESFGRFQKLSLFYENGCGLDFKGRVRCWSISTKIEKRFAPNRVFKEVSTGDKHACGISNRGRLRCWSLNKEKMLDMPEGKFKQLSCGKGLVCAIDGRDEMRCAFLRDFPSRKIEWKQQGYTDISAGGNFVCALSQKGEIECHVYLRDKTGNRMGRTNSPKGEFRKLACGVSHSCAIDNKGRIVCWGDNRAGQSNAPAGRFRTVAAGQFLSCGIKEDGALECWGNERIPAGQWD